MKSTMSTIIEQLQQQVIAAEAALWQARKAEERCTAKSMTVRLAKGAARRQALYTLHALRAQLDAAKIAS